MFKTAYDYGRLGLLEIIVQDDASTDFNVEDICGGEPVQYERNPVNLGFPGNCNMGAARAHGEIILFLNQDTVAHPNWFNPLVSMFDEAAVGIAGPKLVFSDGSIQSCGGWYGGNLGPFHRYLGWAADDWRVNFKEQVSWTTGAALAIRRELFYRVGGFDVGYGRGYFEDTDLCEKVKAEGYEVWYCPTATFTHDAGTNGGNPNFYANSRRFHTRWDAVLKPDTAVAHVNY